MVVIDEEKRDDDGRTKAMYATQRLLLVWENGRGRNGPRGAAPDEEWESDEPKFNIRNRRRHRPFGCIIIAMQRRDRIFSVSLSFTGCSVFVLCFFIRLSFTFFQQREHRLFVCYCFGFVDRARTRERRGNQAARPLRRPKKDRSRKGKRSSARTIPVVVRVFVRLYKCCGCCWVWMNFLNAIMAIKVIVF